MKAALITITLLAICSFAKAQQAVIAKPDSVYASVDVEPVFPQGMAGFYKYLTDSISYPAEAVKNRKEGKVFVSFVVEKDGSITGVKVLRSVSPDIDAEAVRVVSKSPHWQPGTLDSRPVRTQYSMAISFKLPALYTTPDSLKVFTAVEQEPTPRGGIAAFYQYLMQSIQYPENAKRNNIQGKVFLTFVIEKDGSLSDIKVLRGVSADIDAEAIRVLKNCPKWNPGIQSGRPVRVQYQVPIGFSLKTEND